MTTTPLSQLQQMFFEAIHHNKLDTLEQEIVADNVTAPQRLLIYQRNVHSGVLNTLKRVYPAVMALVDERFFNYVATQFIERFPSRSGNLDDYGQEFANFLETFEAVRPLPYLPDVARLEWLYHQAYLAEDAPPIDQQKLSHIQPDQFDRLTFTLHPSVQLLRSDYPVDCYWKIATQPEQQEDDSFQIPARAANIMIARPEYRVALITLDHTAFQLMQAFSQGKTLAEAIYTLDDQEADILEIIQIQIQSGVITGCDV